tara:strand:- start:1732 stop:2778 length:1047 start_codon:yes stop_codon:yes gene_type:complete
MTSPQSHKRKKINMFRTLFILCACFLLSVSFVSVSQAATLNKQLKLEGFVDAGSLFTHTPQNDQTNFSWRLNEIEFSIDATPHKHTQVRFSVHFLQDATTPDFSWMLVDKLLQEAFVSHTFALSKQLQGYVTVGKFFAPQGWDAVNTVDRYQITASFANNVTPNTLTGLKLGIKTDRFELFGFISNGWDLIEDIDLHPTFGLAMSFQLGALLLHTSVTNGREPSAVSSAYQDERLTLLDLQLTLSLLSDRLKIAAEGTLAVISSGQFFYVGQVTAHYMPSRYIGFTVRYGRVSDPGKISDLGADQDEVSVAFLSKPWDGWTAMLEYRVDFVDFALQRHLVGAKVICRF